MEANDYDSTPATSPEHPRRRRRGQPDQNLPVLAGAATNGTTITINGSLNSAAGGNYLVEFYANAVDAGRGPEPPAKKRYLGSATVTTDASGNAFSTTLGVPVAAGEIVSATATLGAGSTSSRPPSSRNVVAGPRRGRSRG